MATAAAMAIVGCGYARAELLAYEGFSSKDYTVDSTIHGINGGTGWSSAWSAVLPGSIGVKSPGLTWSGLPTTNYLVTCTWTTTEATRGIGGAPYGIPGQTVWLSFLIGGMWEPGESPQQLSLLNGTTNVLWLGTITGGDPNRPLRMGVGVGAAGTIVPSAFIKDLHLLVLRMDFTGGNDSVYLWVDPSLDSEPSTAAATMSVTNQDFQFDKLNLYVSSTYASRMDEIRFATTWKDAIGVIPPPPGTILIMK